MDNPGHDTDTPQIRLRIRRWGNIWGNIDGFSRLLETADAIRSQNGLSKIVYGLEPTGNYHKPLTRYLIRCDCNVVLVTGQAVPYCFPKICFSITCRIG